MTQWQNGHVRTESARHGLGSLRESVGKHAARAEGDGWWACVEYFDNVRTIKPAAAAEALNEDTSGLTMAWPGGNLRADRLPDGEYWVTVVELTDGDGAQPCKTSPSQALVWGKAPKEGESDTEFGEGRVKAFTLPIKAPKGAEARVETTRVATKDEHGVYREYATILGRINVKEGAKK
jgi:hypothetical protein